MAIVGRNKSEKKATSVQTCYPSELSEMMLLHKQGRGNGRGKALPCMVG